VVSYVARSFGLPELTQRQKGCVWLFVCSYVGSTSRRGRGGRGRGGGISGYAPTIGQEMESAPFFSRDSCMEDHRSMGPIRRAPSWNRKMTGFCAYPYLERMLRSPSRKQILFFTAQGLHSKLLAVNHDLGYVGDLKRITVTSSHSSFSYSTPLPITLRSLFKLGPHTVTPFPIMPQRLFSAPQSRHTTLSSIN